MTMQGISNVLPKAAAAVAEKSEKAKGTLFETVMSSQGNKQQTKKFMDGFAPDDKVDDGMARKELAANRYQKSKAIHTKSDTAASNDTQDSLTVKQIADDEPDIEEVTVVLASQVTVLLQDLFGLTNDELQDILNSLDLQPESLILCDSESGIMAVNADALKQLVLGVHGVEDASAFLTNDALNTELSEVTNALTDFVCDMLGVTKEELASLKAEAMPELLKQAVDTLQAASETDTMVVDKDTLNQTGTVENTMTAIAEDANSSNLQKDSQQDMSMRDDSEMLQGDDSLVPTHATMAEMFTDRLSQALEKSSGMKGQSVTQTMNQIVEQVVRQVRIRVMPETTSMELRLNPASLGRVNITVAASAGIATATMVVENQMAKEALESQMIHLKEAFNEQGLKVDEVEVTVAEFGLKKDGEGQEQTGSKQSGNRKFRPNESFSDEEKNEDLTTASERRDVNSMVDYTA